MKLIADGGSSSVKWALIFPDKDSRYFETPGVNPAVMSAQAIQSALVPSLAELLENLPQPVSSVEFYGAGCLPGTPADTLRHILHQITSAERILVDSDMLGACRALLGSGPGIAAILGTGSNSALYNGREIVENTSAGGYILGDEFSGAWLGKQLAADFIKGSLPSALASALTDRGLSAAEIIRRVYRPETPRDMSPNRFLASLAPVYSENRGNHWVERTLRFGADLFVDRNLLPYLPSCASDSPDVGFVGSVAVAFADILSDALASRGFSLRNIAASALPGLVAHAKRLPQNEKS